MKKKIVGVMLVVAVAMLAGYNVYRSHTNVELSDLALANIEALASTSEGGEGGEGGITCNQSKHTSPGYCWAYLGNDCFRMSIRWNDCDFVGYQSVKCVTPCP